jgi:DNA end-binding protein Ku
MSADWQPDEYRDSFQDKIMALVAKKAKAGKIEDVESSEGVDERKSADVIDLTELLKRSLAGKSPAKKPAAKKTRKAS